MRYIKQNPIHISAKLVIEKVNQLTDIAVQRECLCRLLKLEIEEVQNLIVQEIVPLFEFETISYDIQLDQAQQLIHLEEIVSEIMEAKLKSNELNLFIPIRSIYQSILEHLWLLPHLEFGNHCTNLLIQNKNAILSKMKRWKDSLDQLASEEKISHFIPKNLEKSVLRLFEPLPEVVAKEIEEQKSVIHKSREMTSRILEIIANFYGSQGDYPRAIFYAEILLEILIQKLPEMFEKKGMLDKIMEIHRNLATWNQFLKQYERAIYYGKEALRIARESGNPYEVIINLKGMGSLYIAQGRGKLALPFYTEARSITQILKLTENESKILTDLADAYLSINNNEKAIRCYQAALNLTEEESEQALIYAGIGDAHARAQRYQLAKEAYQKAINFRPQDDFFFALKVQQSLASLFNNIGQYGTAIYHAEESLKLTQHPSVQLNELVAFDSKFSALTVLGSIYGAFGDYTRALNYFTQALKIAEKLDPFKNCLGRVYVNLGTTYSNMENYHEAVNYYNKALKIIKEPSRQSLIIANLGSILFLSGSFVEAIKYFIEAKKINDHGKTKNKTSMA
ncbi:hypothetical protein DB44_AL00260 [Candidatus Protochlamydia amoebophila]|uniref:Uncharacterized protein n=1 Tax=Candidatus Protochlamydia amoebophila TaxID=362787 RepID=A0A0C1K4U3_9BACT|nr:hypothetical protein DB44_AL00260 [Candidatus Protochlamydia amoebophila]